MKLKFSIASRIGISYGLLLISWGVGLYISNNSFNKSKTIKDKIVNNYRPSGEILVELAMDISKSRNYTKELINNKLENKKLLSDLHSISYKNKKSKLISFSNLWNEDKSILLMNIFSSADTLFFEQQMLMNKIDSVDVSKNQAEDIMFSYENIFLKAEHIVSRIHALNVKINEEGYSENESLLDSIEKIEFIYLWIGVFLFFIILLMSIGTIRSLIMPINRLKIVLKRMSHGELPDKPVKAGSDEVGAAGKALNDLITGLKKLSAFSNEIGKENYAAEFEPLGKKDELGNSLLLMRDNLKKAFKETMVRRKENFQRSWTSQGLAEFGEMLRESKDNLEELTNQILTKLIRYLDASVGGLFTINDDDKDNVFLELIAFYAYDRRKYIEKTIKIGESLVGQCVLENETIFMSEIPKDYIHITSGTGRDNPRSLVIVPLKLNEEVYGVVELASFKKIEPFQIEFIEKIGESIASTISSVKVNIHTSKLLQESNEKSQRLTKQEEESRKQIDDMEKSLDKLKSQLSEERDEHKNLITEYQSEILNLRKQNDKASLNNDKLMFEMKNISRSVDNSVGAYSLSVNGEFIEANEKYLKLVSMSLNELKEKRISDFKLGDSSQSTDVNKFIPILLSGRKYERTTKYMIGGEPVWLSETFTPLYDEQGKFAKIFCIVKDETNFTKMNIEQTAMIEKLKADVRKLKQRI